MFQQLMNMKTLTLLIILLLTYTLYPQQWENVSRLNENIGGPSGFMSDGKNLYLISYYETDLVLNKSTDKGQSWFEQYRVETRSKFGTIYRARNAVLTDKDYIYVTFSDLQSIAKSTDGGETFEMKDIGPGPSFYQICMYNRNIGVGMSGSDIFITTDGWETYHRISTSFSSTYYNPIFINEHTVQFATSRNKAIILINFDLNEKLWDEVYKFPVEDHFTYLDLKYTRNGLGFLAGLRRNGNGDRATDVMFQSTDYGKSWFKTIDQDVEPQWGFSDVSFNDTLNGFVTGQFGKIMMTNDGGKNWDYVQDLDFYVGQDTSYGPFTTEILWMEDKPYIMSDFRNLYSIVTDYFKIYDKYNITGKILNNGASVYAPLRIDNLVKYTLDDGSYEFDKMPTKKYTVTPEPSDYFSFSPESLEVDVVNSDVSVDFEATRKRYDIVGKIDNKINADIDDLKFQIQYETNNGFLYVLDTIVGLSNANNLELKDVIATENITICALDENVDYKVIPSEYKIDLNQDTVLHFEILDKDKNFTISGCVKINGKGIGEVSIILFGKEQQLVHTDSDGNFRFYNLDSGYCSIYQNASNSTGKEFNPRSGYSHFYVSDHIENKDFLSSSFEYSRIRGKVTDRNGRGIPNIRILPFDNFDLPNIDTFGVRTRFDGRYTSGFFNVNSFPESFYLSLSNKYNYSPQYNIVDKDKKLDGYDFVIDTVISSVPYRITKPISIYPNPAKDWINLDLSGIGRQVISISIFDIDGKLVRKEDNISESLKTLDTSTLIKGTYYIQIDIEGGLIDRYTFIKN